MSVKFRRLSAVAGVFVIGAALSAAVINVSATSGPPRATIEPYHLEAPGMEISSDESKDIVITEFTIPPGSSTGWHHHPGPTFIIVTQGVLTRYGAGDTEEDSGPACHGTTYASGTGFVEPPSSVHIARNEGTETVAGKVAYLNVPIGGAVKTPVASPGNCPF